MTAHVKSTISITVDQTAPVSIHGYWTYTESQNGRDQAHRDTLSQTLDQALASIEALPNLKAAPGAEAFTIKITADHGGVDHPNLPPPMTGVSLSGYLAVKSLALRASDSV
jgi:hypothetical protein